MPNFNDAVIDEFRSNNGEVTGPFAKMKLLLVNSIGAKSGEKRTHPIAYTMDKGNYVIVASKGGAPSNPDWYFNLVAHPDVTIEVGNKKIPVHATLASGEERERLFNHHASHYPVFNGYKAKTSREIPVFVLEKKDLKNSFGDSSY